MVPLWKLWISLNSGKLSKIGQLNLTKICYLYSILTKIRKPLIVICDFTEIKICVLTKNGKWQTLKFGNIPENVLSFWKLLCNMQPWCKLEGLWKLVTYLGNHFEKRSFNKNPCYKINYLFEKIFRQQNIDNLYVSVFNANL